MTTRINGKRPKGWHDWKPRTKSVRARLELAQQVLDEYDHHLPITLRFMFYRMTDAGYEKTDESYANLSDTMGLARRAGLIPMSALKDEDFRAEEPSFVDNVDDAADTYLRWASTEQLDRQKGQDERLAIWCEAVGTVQFLRPIAQRHGIPVYCSGGFDSITTKHAMAMKFVASGATVLHLGDYDASGVSVFSALEEDIVGFAGDHLRLERIALTREQIDLHDLTTGIPKSSDQRDGFSDDITCQLESLTPEQTEAILMNEIESRWDMDVYEEVMEEEQEMRDELVRRLGGE